VAAVNIAALNCRMNLQDPGMSQIRPPGRGPAPPPDHGGSGWVPSLSASGHFAAGAAAEAAMIRSFA